MQIWSHHPAGGLTGAAPITHNVSTHQPGLQGGLWPGDFLPSLRSRSWSTPLLYISAAANDLCVSASGMPFVPLFCLLSAGASSPPSSLWPVLCLATFNSSSKSLFKNNPIFQEAPKARMVDVLHRGQILFFFLIKLFSRSEICVKWSNNWIIGLFLFTLWVNLTNSKLRRFKTYLTFFIGKFYIGRSVKRK